MSIELIADASPAILGLEAALLDAGALVDRVAPRNWRWASDVAADVWIVHVPAGGAEPGHEFATARAGLDVLSSLVSRERVIGLLEEPTVAAGVAGLSDFILPPFRPAEVITRLRATLRTPRPLHMLRAGNLEMNVANRTVAIDHQPVELTFAEFEILRALMAANGRVLSRDDLQVLQTRRDSSRVLRGVDVHIHRLRSKLQRLQGARIETLRHVGYRLRVVL